MSQDTLVEGSVSFDDERPVAANGSGERAPFLQFKSLNETRRMAFLSDEVVMRKRHYKKGVGYRRCLSYTGFCPACVQKIDNKDASDAYGAAVWVFDLDPMGNADPNGAGNVYTFIFGSDKFAALRNIKKMYGTLVGLDINVSCTDPKFQKLSFTPWPQHMSLSANPQIFERMEARLRSFGKIPLDLLMAKEVDHATMIKDYGLSEVLLQHLVNINGAPPTVPPATGAGAPPAMALGNGGLSAAVPPAAVPPAAVPPAAVPPAAVPPAAVPPAVHPPIEQARGNLPQAGKTGQGLLDSL